jgi:hypothetical protein
VPRTPQEGYPRKFSTLSTSELFETHASPLPTDLQTKNRWHGALARREQALLSDVDKMLVIRNEAREGGFVEELTSDQV